MNAYTTLLTKQTGAVLKITANRPDVLNAQSRILLEEQLRTIKKALGENGEGAREMASLGEAITAAHMPPEVQAHVRKELQRLERMHEAAGEASTLRTKVAIHLSIEQGNVLFSGHAVVGFVGQQNAQFFEAFANGRDGLREMQVTLGVSAQRLRM